MNFKIQLQNFNFALKNAKAKTTTFKLIKLQTVDTYEYSKHTKSTHQRETRNPTLFHFIVTKNSIKLLDYKHGIKQSAKLIICVTIKGENRVFMDLFRIYPTKII